MSKTNYWITSAAGTYGQVEGVEERDTWTPLGWRVADEPGPTDFVFLRYAETGGVAPFAYGAVGIWQQMGWELSAPPPHVDPTKDPRLFDHVSVPAEDAAPKKSTTKTPAAGTDKNAKE